MKKVKTQYPHANCKTFSSAKEGLDWIHDKMKTYLLYKNKQRKKTSLNYEALSLQQKETIEGTCRLFHKGKNVITIYGAAGTGKTTIVKFIMESFVFD